MEDTETELTAKALEKLVDIEKPILTEPDTIPIWNTKTGLESKYKVYSSDMLLRKLRQKNPDGTPLFSVTKPAIEPVTGKLKCYLHKGDPNREHWDEMGFPTCSKDNLSAPFHVRRHMQKRHKVEWAAMEEERKDREKQEERDFQRSLISSFKGEKPPLYVSEKDKAKNK
uniref:Uncharacterized protein n=1 Tax=viral metagenome TaxID=1070528 RepID=A0A6M3IG70_9ZZZZ